jgi:hypothetical protein
MSTRRVEILYIGLVSLMFVGFTCAIGLQFCNPEQNISIGSHVGQNRQCQCISIGSHVGQNRQCQCISIGSHIVEQNQHVCRDDVI